MTYAVQFWREPTHSLIFTVVVQASDHMGALVEGTRCLKLRATVVMDGMEQLSVTITKQEAPRE